MTKGKNLTKAGTAIEGATPALTVEQQANYERAEKIVRARPRRPQIRFVEKRLEIGDGETVQLDGMLASEAMGSRSGQVIEHLLIRIASTIKPTNDEARDGDAIASAIAMVASVEPRNELEATIAVQMVAANEAAMLCFRRMNEAQLINQMSAYSAMANKAMRSFALHVETLAKLRRGGEQVVKHVHVNEGGQALIAHTVNAKGGGGE